ncbi:MAG: CRISPR-associated protein Cas4 [Methanothermobacter sp.]|nr:CRISPR-associated protein Cas4 [Methanothermobacter sp.]
MISDAEKKLLIRGTQVNYYFVCRTKLWLFSHHIQMEHESDIVELGKLLHDETYKREEKSLILDDLISADFVRKGKLLEVHEVKKSDKIEEAHFFQLLYYLYYLKKEKGIEEIRGFIDYPKLRKKKEIRLTPDNEKRLKKVLEDIDTVVRGDFPRPQKKSRICRSCAYLEFCWA